jgi:hypothetical protein
MKQTHGFALSSTLRALALALALTAATTATASLSALQDLIANPTDGGTGPGIWLSTSGTDNAGSDNPGPPPAGLATYTLTEANTDFFGTAGQAFALRTQDGEGNPTTSGAGIAGSGATTYLTGDNATLVLTFKTPSTFATVSLVERGPDSAANSFELVLLNSGVLRLSYRNTGSSDRTNLQTLSPDTWYYVAITWDLSNSTNNLKWHVGQMGSAVLSSGAITATVVGDTTSAIRIAGRANSLFNFGPYQNIAMYDRTLSEGAIADQFSAITETVAEPGAVSVQLSGGMVEIQFTGILQDSENLDGWEDLDPQPASPLQYTPDTGDKRFFRARPAP